MSARRLTGSDHRRTVEAIDEGEIAMFAQFIEGWIADSDALRQQYETWLEELAPTATGWLGSTAGITDDDRAFIAVRFTSAEAARANSERPAQGEWWKDTEDCFAGPVEFLDCDDVELFLDGGADDAGFVQVIRGRFHDVDQARTVMHGMDDELRAQRSDVLGGYVGTRPDGTFVQVVYFTSEDEAREGERDEGAPDEFAALLDGEPRYLDLPDPWLSSPNG